MVGNFLGGYLACLPYVLNNYFSIYLLSHLTTLGESLIY